MQSDFRHTTRFRIAVAGLAIVAAAAACGDDFDNGPSAPVYPPSTVVSATGDITAAVTEYRNTLGAPPRTSPMAGWQTS